MFLGLVLYSIFEVHVCYFTPLIYNGLLVKIQSVKFTLVFSPEH